ncbi:MAG TPA: hypothetical protein ENJ85_05095 [Oceanithermus profundus]|uniref:Uncharacterized protein n=1 Tax=Oceanithermus profundus TaxID=187137 RepID=A0A7C5WTS5_9DEIN|nr:hypothetical protein [Oceanithermus profundus]
MKYVVPPAHAAALAQVLGSSYAFAYEDRPGGVLVHDPDVVAAWPPGSPDLDAAVVAAGLGGTYSSYLATLAVLPDLRCKIFRYVPSSLGEFDQYDPPFSIDYRVDLDRRLQPKFTFDQGTLVRVEYYAEASKTASGVEFSDLILEEVYDYTRDFAGFAVDRTLTITWYREDGTAHPTTKQMVKLYDMQNSMQEGKRRRTNIVQDLEARVVTHLLGQYGQTDPAAAFQMGRDFIALYRDQINDFVAGGSSALRDAILADVTTTWLDDVMADGRTVRAMLAGELDI